MAHGAVAEAPEALVREVWWQASSVDAGTVDRTLQRLWSEIADGRHRVTGRTRAAVDGALMRTRTLNLIAIADTPEDADRIKQVVTELSEFFPSRTVILIRHGVSNFGEGLQVAVSVKELPTKRAQAPIRFETITVAAPGDREELLASVASPVLVPELPDFVWCPSASPAGSALLQELLPITDRLIVDTSLTDDPSTTLPYLATTVAKEGDGLAMSDATWTRLRPWRQTIAQFFDQSTTQPYLERIEDVVISHAGRGEDGRSGLTAGLLLAGWLATRLGWRAPGEELVRSRDGWKLTLRAGSRGRSREVILTLKQTDDPAAAACLKSVAIEAGGDAPATFQVERVSDEGIQTTGGGPAPVSRIVYARTPDDGRLLSMELREFGSDPIFEQALAFAANLWPEGVTA